VPYTISKATDPLNINEQEYASGPKIKFTAFTSCIGVIAKEGGTLTAVHLVMIGRDGEPFGADAKDVPLVISKLPKSADAITIFGCIDFWRDSESRVVQKAFEQLAGTLKEKKVGLYHQSTRKEGTYGAEIGNAGEIKITF
jgi:hypothetical protein